MTKPGVLKFEINQAVLDCWACHRRPQSDTYVCSAGHVFCERCISNHREACGGVGIFNACRSLEYIVPRIKVKCDCERYFAYRILEEHERECPSAKSSIHPARRKCRVKITLLLCATCQVPLQPPVFRSGKGHLVCSHCYYRYQHTIMLYDTDAYDHCIEMEYLVRRMMVRCGCKEYVPFSMLNSHQLDCPFIPTKLKIALSSARTGSVSEPGSSSAGKPWLPRPSITQLCGQTGGKAASKIGEMDKHIADTDNINPENRKKRVLETALKTPAYDKKAKIATSGLQLNQQAIEQQNPSSVGCTKASKGMGP